MSERRFSLGTPGRRARVILSMLFKKRFLSGPGQRTIWLLVLAVLAIVALLLAFTLRIQYKRTLSEAEDRLMAEARAVDENLGVNLTIVNLLLSNIIQRLESTSHLNPAEFDAYLRRQVKLIPGIRTFVVTDKSGRVILSNRDEVIGYDARERDYFNSAVAAGGGRLVISRPFKTFLGSKVVSIARVLRGRQGIRGVVAASLDQQYFATLLGSVLYSADNRVSLVHSSGTVFITVPDTGKLEGKNLNQPGSLFLRHRDSGQRFSLQRGITTATGENRILAFVTSSLPGLPVTNPLIVMASRDMHQIFAPWRRELAVTIGLYLLFAGITIAVTVVALHHREERRKAAEEHLKLRTLESVGLLAHGIAHDFNNLLTIIVGYIEISKLSGQGDEKLIKNLNEARNNCLRARELSERLTTFATGGNPVLELMPVAGVIRAGVQEALKGSAVATEFTLPEDLRQVLIDEGQMHQVFFNLALNAREAMPAGGRFNVHAENFRIPANADIALQEGDYIRVTLRDTGAGIERKNRTRIFDPYFSTKDKFNQKGLGLSLAVCHSIVTRHGGRISAESAPGEGTSIHLVLPAAPQAGA